MEEIEVELPNGVVMEGVPANATKEQIMQMAIQMGVATPEDFGAGSQQPQAKPQTQAPAAGPEYTGVEKGMGGLEVATSAITGGIGDFVGNIQAIGQATPLAMGARRLAEAMGTDKLAERLGLDWSDENLISIPDTIKKAMTYEPATASGRQYQKELSDAIGGAIKGTVAEDAINMMGRLSESLERKVEETTGSKVLAKAAVAVPEVAMDLFPAGLVGRGAKAAKKVSEHDIRDALFESPDQLEQVKKFRDAAYKDLEDSGVRLRGNTVSKAIGSVKDRLASEDLDVDLQGLRPMFRKLETVFGPKTVNNNGMQVTMTQRLSDIENMRKYINKNFPEKGNKSAIASINSAIDDFVANDLESAIIPNSKMTKTPDEVKKLFGTARDLAGRAIRTREIDEMFFKASNSVEPDEVLRNQMKKLIDNPRRRRYYSDSEIESMRDVVKGNVDKEAGYLKMLGRLGMTPKTMPVTVARFLRAFGDDKYRRMPVVTRAKAVGKAISRDTEKTIRAAEAIRKQVTGGKNATKIVERYLKAVPRGKRNPRELAEFLSDPNIDLNEIELRGSKLEREAIEMARGLRLVTAASTMAITDTVDEAMNEEQN